MPKKTVSLEEFAPKAHQEGIELSKKFTEQCEGKDICCVFTAAANLMINILQNVRNRALVEKSISDKKDYIDFVNINIDAFRYTLKSIKEDLESLAREGESGSA